MERKQMKNAIAQWKCENISIIRVRTVAKILLYIVDVIICVSPIILLLVIYNVPIILNSKISTFIFLLISGLYFLGEIYSFYVVIRCKLPYKHIFIFTKMLCYLLYILIGYVTTVPEACDILLYANFPWIDIVIILFHSMSTYYLFHYIYILKTLASIFLIIGLGCILILYSVAVNQIIDFRNLEKLVESKYLYQIDREYLHIDKEYLINNNILDKYSNKFLENSQSIDRIIDENLEYIEQCKRIKVEHRLSVNKPKEPIIQLDDLILTLENHKEINILFLDQLDALIYYERLATFCYDLFSGNLSMEKDFYLLLQFLHILIEGCDNNDIIYNYLKYYENINQFFMNIDHSILINNNTIKK